jgi:hypothetical protein
VRTSLKKCRNCKAEFEPRFNSTQTVCGTVCAIEQARKKTKKQYRAQTTKLRKEFNDKDRTYQIKLTTAACHKYIMARDAGLPCIACGITTGQFHASHYYSKGHAPELRWHPDNIHRGCAQCNTYKSGNIAEYTIGLQKKIGIKGLANLARCRTPQNWTLEDIKDIREYYEKKLQELVV